MQKMKPENHKITKSQRNLEMQTKNNQKQNITKISK